MGYKGGNNMISVIISTYNRAQRLKKAIESVLNQTYQDFEIIVVDDKSTDNTKEVLESFKDPRISVIYRKRNSGCDVVPKNQGIMAAKGEYIAFLDDDNIYRPDHLAVLRQAMKEDERLDLVYGDRWIVDETGTVKPQLGMTSDFDPPTLMKRNFIDTSDVLVKRQALIDVGGFDETVKKYVDWNVYVRMLKTGKRFKHVPVVITDYHLHPGMKSVKVKTKGDAPGVFVPEWDPYDCEIELPYLEKVIVPPKVAIFSITYDRLEYTKKSFESLRKTAKYPYDHFIVDNGSTDGTVEWLKKNYENVIYNDKNYGISKASNQAIDLIKKGDYRIIVKWDNDCMGLTPGWLDRMVNIWKANHRMALSCYVQGLVDHPGGAPRLGYGMLKGELVGITKHLGGICCFADADAYNTFRWDEDSFLHGVQDMEFSQYLAFHGFSMGYLENYFVSHGPKDTSQQKIDYPEYFERRIKEKQTRYEKNR
jgi:glycosyltransferase involved in cell wall biosynthesis